MYRPPPPPLFASDALFLDFDGTLVEIAATPDAVEIPPDLYPQLNQLLEKLDGALAIVSGRSLTSIDEKLSPLRLPGSGLHGAEWRIHSYDDIERLPTASLQHVAKALHHQFDEDPRVLIEDKGVTIALHFRNAPEREADCIRAMQSVAVRENAEVILGKMVVELRPSGIDKGRGIRHLLEHPPFHNRRAVFIGDDVTDEDGFSAVNAINGITIKVGEGPSVAHHGLADAAAVRAWLQQSPNGSEASP